MMEQEKNYTANNKILTIMQNHNLPTDELKTFGIINDDLTFSKKLSADDIQKFLQGYTIVADNEKNRATFQLTEDNTKLKVIFLERDKVFLKSLKIVKKKFNTLTLRNFQMIILLLQKKLSYSIVKLKK